MATNRMTLEDWLDDLCVRFIINLPKADLSSVARICFQIEEAQWFYEDFIRLIDPTLPSMSLRSFMMKMFEYCPLLASFSADEHLRAFEEFMQYKTRVPVRGAILLNDNMDATVLVRGFKKGATWSFPRGKINKDEDDLDCAVREVYEEIGFDIRLAGLINEITPAQYFEVTMQNQQVRLYVFRGISENTVFGTRTRKEIGAIRWYKVDELPTYRKKKGGRINGAGGPGNEKFYMVAPFMVQLRQWVVKQKKIDALKAGDSGIHHHALVPYEETTDDNVIHEPAQSSAAPDTNPDLYDNATRELQRLLRVRPQSDQQASQALMSLLQPGTAAGSEVHRHPRENDVDARTVQHQHHLQHHLRAEQPQFSTEMRPRPYVTYVNVTAGPHDNHQPVLSEKVHQSLSQPVQLVHPQPLPPQVQKAMLLNDVIPSSPQITEHSTGRPGLPGFSQNNQYASQDQSGYAHRPQGAQSERQLPAHSANLLNVLKGNVAQPSAGQSSAPRVPGQSISRSPENNPQQQHQFSVAGKAFVGQYNNSGVPSEYNSIPVNGVHANPSSSDARLLRPTDKHRAGLLEMFKKSEPLTQNQLDGEGMNRRPSQQGEDAKKHRSSKYPSTASALQAAAHENGGPMQTHPEANLPFRALTILSRPKQGQESSESTVPRPSPSSKKNSPRPNQLVSSKTQQLGQSYPYGSTQPNPLSLFPTPPSASSLPVPGGFQFRQEPTAEQKSSLLSLFGKPKPNTEQNKGKETLMPDQSLALAAPRSRLGSVASSRGEGKLVLRGNASRRGSQSPLSPADKEFLMNFLNNASSNARR
ncbi:uncharacterized protein GGS22DRAFT_51592 [Annulohypoxylon maeteangense]|uniref:uncharacterized protein n=1 Tax=Annulohypoxylon maeteangense TaxID=1927788 RepID=UPI002007316C|nr:uncharacterized protein GGS22DRAFT_51592 [Annulohypoxylon maeteangense]KAI0881864.1 hypothetical protein GGS22DRAFT_51592 [Annulohypoxylon maeteangense]